MPVMKACNVHIRNFIDLHQINCMHYLNEMNLQFSACITKLFRLVMSNFLTFLLKLWYCSIVVTCIKLLPFDSGINFDEFLGMYKRLFIQCRTVISGDVSGLVNSQKVLNENYMIEFFFSFKYMIWNTD